MRKEGNGVSNIRLLGRPLFFSKINR